MAAAVAGRSATCWEAGTAGEAVRAVNTLYSPPGLSVTTDSFEQILRAGGIDLAVAVPAGSELVTPQMSDPNDPTSAGLTINGRPGVIRRIHDGGVEAFWEAAEPSGVLDLLRVTAIADPATVLAVIPDVAWGPP